jgi:hypothetical protein
VKPQANWEAFEQLMNEIVEDQKGKLLALGRRLIPILTPEDLLQPVDYPELENNPHFRYEEGILAGLQTMQMALRAYIREIKPKNFRD